MNINNTSQINFNAKFINNISIKKLDSKCGEYQKFKASFIEFEPQNKNDLEAIQLATDNWRGESYARNIANKAQNMSNFKLSQRFNHIYMITTQRENLDKLSWEKILGMAHLETEAIDENELKYLQVKPSTKHGSETRKYKDVGSRMIETLKKMYNSTITLIASYKAVEFYSKQGFKLTDPEFLEFTWKHKGMRK